MTQIVPDVAEVDSLDYDTLKLYIHVAGNLKVPESVAFLEKIINNERVEHFRCVDFIHSLSADLEDFAVHSTIPPDPL